jgi:hypothetical protein
MLAYYVEWHLKQSLAPLLFEDEEIDDRIALLMSLKRIPVNRGNLKREKKQLRKLYRV